MGTARKVVAGRHRAGPPGAGRQTERRELSSGDYIQEHDQDPLGPARAVAELSENLLMTAAVVRGGGSGSLKALRMLREDDLLLPEHRDLRRAILALAERKQTLCHDAILHEVISMLPLDRTHEVAKYFNTGLDCSHDPEGSAEIILDFRRKEGLLDLSRKIYLAQQDGNEDAAAEAMEEWRELRKGGKRSGMLGGLPGGLEWASHPETPVPCVLSGAFPRNATSILFGQCGFGKSFLSLEFAFSVVTGRELVRGFAPEGPGRAVFITLEDAASDVHRRALRLHRFFEFSRDEQRQIAEHFKILERPGSFSPVVRLQDGTFAPGQDLQSLRDELAGLQPDLVIMDPLASLLGPADENSNGDARKVESILRGAMPPDCALLLVAHISKQELKDPEASALTPRGATAWADAVRFGLSMRPPTKKERLNMAEYADHVVALENPKHSNIPKRPVQYLERIWRTPESAGVLATFKLPEVDHKAQQELDSRLEWAVLEVVRTFPGGLSKTDLTAARKEDAKDRRDTAMAQIAALAKGCKVTRDSLTAVVGYLLETKQLEQPGDDLGGRGKRRVLVAKPTPETYTETAQTYTEPKNKHAQTYTETCTGVGLKPTRTGPPIGGFFEPAPLGDARPLSGADEALDPQYEEPEDETPF